jgi:glycerol uptake facilitator-like aquaporin
MGKTQKYLAEALGTFALVGIGSFAILSSAGTGRLDVVAIALGFGLALLVGLYAFGEVSGGHYNPAVSLGMFLDRSRPPSSCSSRSTTTRSRPRRRTRRTTGRASSSRR